MTNASIVLYHSNKQQVMHLLDLLLASEELCRLFLIDNSETKDEDYVALNSLRVEYIFNRKNLGYGSAHNIAIRKSIEMKADYHLVVNSDIDFSSSIISELVDYMDANSVVGQLMPQIVNPQGEMQYLCKLLPTPFDLFGRRFLPNKWTKKSAERFELRCADYSQPLNVPYLSGCFMLFRVEALQQVGLFDERFFLYPEDIDITRRMHKKYKTLYYPFATVVHQHERASYKSFRLLLIHIVNICRYFNKWGWLFDAERNAVNHTTLSAIAMLDKQHR